MIFPSESHFEVRSFLTRITCSLLVQYSRNELPNTWFWQFSLKKIISRAEFDELCYFGTQNPWNFGENCKRIGLDSKYLSLKLIITDDIYWHIFSLCTGECFEGHPLTTRIFLAWLGMIGTETLVCKNYQSWNHLIAYGYHFTAVCGINRTVEYLWSKMPISKRAWYYVNIQQLISSYSIIVTHQSFQKRYKTLFYLKGLKSY